MEYYYYVYAILIFSGILGCSMLKDIIDDILERQSDLKEFEDELKKHKDKITPGQVGES